MGEVSLSCQELSGDTHYAIVQREKVVRAPAGYKTPSQPWQPMAEMPPNAPHEALRLVPTHQIDGRQSPEQADIMLGVLSGCVALKALLCSGDDASP